jgi:hypothetical protein
MADLTFSTSSPFFSAANVGGASVKANNIVVNTIDMMRFISKTLHSI